MAESFPELRPAARILLGPGPSNVNPRVMKAMASPVVGHLDPDFLKVMENIKQLLRLVFRTKNEITFPVSGTGSAGMETVIANLVEDGDEVVVGVNGAFGTRLAEVASRQGAKVHKVEAEWGTIVEPAQSSGGVEGGEESQTGRSRPRRDFDRDTSADRGDRRAGASARRDDRDRRGDVARVCAGRN